MTTSIRVERTMDATPARVWDAFTTPDLMDRWFCPDPELVVSSHADLREGGAFRINMGGEYIASGTYERLDPPSLLECTWRWEHQTTISRLTVRFQPDDGGTDVVVTQDHLADTEDAEGHRHGWELSLDRLDELLAAEPA